MAAPNPVSESLSKKTPESAFTFLPRGAIIQEFSVAGLNIVQNFPEAQLYNDHNSAYFGETIGRTTNRITDAEIRNLNGKTYGLAKNSGKNSLHGGTSGWGKKEWKGPQALKRNGKEGMLFSYLSKDGEEGYPGTVECNCWYTAGLDQGKTVLEVEYEVEMVGDEVEETVVGVTNHSYFNLNPTAPTIEGTVATLGTAAYQEINQDGSATGKIHPLYHDPLIPSTPHTPFIFTSSTPNPDDCFVLDPQLAPSSIPIDTRTRPLRILATLYHPSTGLHLEVRSTEPAFQFYAGKNIDVPEVTTSKGLGVPARGPRAGICIEPSRYVDAAGREEWRNMVLLRKGQTWGSKSVYTAWKE